LIHFYKRFLERCTVRIKKLRKIHNFHPD